TAELYDPATNTWAGPSITAGSLASSDSATITESFDTRNVGTGKTLTPSVAIRDGNGGNKYAVTVVNNTNGVISKAALTVTANNLTKPYGNTLAFTGTEFSSVGLANNDAVTSVTLTSGGTSATAAAAASPYSIVPSVAAGSGLDNYT